MFAGVNGLAVVVCVVVAIVVGFVRYSKPVFLKPWLAGIGKPPEFALQRGRSTTSSPSPPHSSRLYSWRP